MEKSPDTIWRYLDFWSEWRDSNSRHPGPKPGALPTGPHPDIELREKARCGQICGQGNSTTFSGNFQEQLLGKLGRNGGACNIWSSRTNLVLQLPNVACYQLHYTRIFGCHDYSTKIVRFKVFSYLWSFMWSKRVFGPVSQLMKIPQMPVLQRVPGFSCSYRG